MRRTMAITATALAVLTAPGMGSAAVPAADPIVKDVHWVGGSPRAGEPARLFIRAVDPDGVIIAVWIRWGDGFITVADLFCLPDFEVGEATRVFVEHTFDRAGHYAVKVTAESLGPCDEPSELEEGPTAHLPTAVRA